jgi:hypothetical protein
VLPVEAFFDLVVSQRYATVHGPPGGVDIFMKDLHDLTLDAPEIFHKVRIIDRRKLFGPLSKISW